MDRFFIVFCSCSCSFCFLVSLVSSCWFCFLVVMFMWVCSSVLVWVMCLESEVRCCVVVVMVVMVGESWCCMNLFRVCVF